ncbi:MAG TPA: hypothetical protein VKE53_13500 [Pseudolabrys sp.]|jgi:hypothetical protein|nr:hypothetical protein [Pseudolabrys sp.]
MKGNLILLIAGATLGLDWASFAAPAAAQPAKTDSALILSAATKKSTTARQRRDQDQIACTVAGCHPIPSGCHPQMGYSWDGIPTGFDIVVCAPPRGRGG